MGEQCHWSTVATPYVETYYCLWAAGSDDNVFVVEVTDPKDDLR